MTQNLSFAEEKTRLTAYIRGELDHHSAESIRRLIDHRIALCDPKELILDFSLLTFMDSAGIGLILGRFRRMQEAGGRLSIQNVPEKFERMLTLSGIPKIIHQEGTK